MVYIIACPKTSTNSLGSDLDQEFSTDSSGSDLDQDLSTDSPRSDFEIEGRTVTGSDQNPPTESTNSDLVNTALSHIDKVKHRFQNEPEVYRQLIDKMMDFKKGISCTDKAIHGIAIIFSSTPDLIEDFKQFHPKNPDYSTKTLGPGVQLEDPGGSILNSTLAPESTTSYIVSFNTAIGYVTKVKHRFQNQPEVYTIFLDTLYCTDYRDEPTPSSKVYQEIAILISCAPDLLENLRQILPKSSFIPSQADVGSLTPSDTDEGSEGRKRKRI
jgi:histone deacetylase complex regulatory component SIN3